MQEGDKPADEHIQDFKNVALEASYDGYLLVVEFKWSLNQGLHRWLTELQPGLVTIEQWYDEVIKVDHQWRIARDEEAFYGKVHKSVCTEEAPHHSTAVIVVVSSAKTDF